MDEIQKLYDALVDKNLYSKTVEDFKVQFEDEEYKKKVFDAVVDNDLFSKDFNTFDSKYSLLDDTDSEEISIEDKEVDNTSDFLSQYISKDPETQISKDLSYFEKNWDKEKENVGNVWFGGKGLEESIVPKLNQKFNKWGFVFEQDDITGDAVKVSSTKDPSISKSFNIDNPSEGMRMLKAFIEKNKSDNAVFSENIDELSITDDYVKNLVKATKEKDEEKKNELLTGVSRKIYASEGINYDEIKNLNQKIKDNESEDKFVKENLVVGEFEKIDPRSGGVISYYNVEDYKPTSEEIEKYSNIFNKDGSLKINPKKYIDKLKQENSNILDITAHESIYKAKRLEAKLFNKFKNKETSKILESSEVIKSKSSNLNKEFIKVTGKSIADSESVNLEIDKNIKYFDGKIKELTGGVGLNELSSYKPKTQEEANSINNIIQSYSTYYSNNVKPVIDIYSQYSSLSSEAEQLDDIGNTINTMLNFDGLINYRGQYENNAFNSVLNNARRTWSQGEVNRDFVNAAYGITDITDEEQMASVSKRIAEQTALQRGILTSEVWERYNNAGSVSEQMRILKTNPTEVLLSLFGSSMSMFLSTGFRTFFPIVGGATATGAVLGSGAGPGGTLAGGLSGLSKGLLSWQTITAFNMEMGSAFSEELTKNGYDLADADQVILGLRNKKVTDAAVSRGVKRGVPIAIANFLGGAVANGVVNPLATTGRQVVSQFAKGALIEPIFEGAGEATAQLAADGELLGTEIFNEMIGGMPGSQSNIAVTFASNQYTNKQANIASKLEDINYISENNFGYNDVRAFTNRLLGKKKITASQAKKIVENARIVDETNSIMRDSPKFVSGKNKNNARKRISDLIQHRNLVEKSLENAKGDVKSRLSETLGSIESEINEIASTGKTLAKSDVKTVNDLANLYRRNLSSGLQFINKKLGKDNYEAVILNEETKKQLKKDNPELYEAINELNIDYNTSGFIMPNVKGKNYIVVNEDNIDNSLNAAIAAGDTSGFSVMSHEILHAVLSSAFEEKEIKDLSIELEKYVLESDDSKISAESKKRIKTRLLGYEKEYGGKDKRYYEEVFTTLSDEMQDENIDYNRQDKSFWLKIADTINDYIYKNKSSFDEVTRGSLKIKTAEEAFNFIKDYNKVFNKNAKISKDKIKTKAPVVEENKEKVVFSKTEDNKTIKEIFDKFTGPAENRKFKSKEEFKNSPEFFDALLEIEQSNTLDASIRNTVSEAYLDMNPGFVREVKEKISDKYRSEYDASKNSLFGWLTGKNVSGQPLINLVSGDIQIKRGKKPSTVTTTKKVGGEDSKVTVAETLVSDEISPEDYTDMKLAQDKLKKNKPQQSAIANKIGLTENELNLARREIINFLRKTDRPAMTDPKKFFKALVDYTTGKGVQPGGFANVIYDKLSLPKNGELSTKNRESFVRKIAEDLIALNKVDPAVMRRSKWTPFYKLEIKNMNPTQMQKAIDEGRIPSTSNLKSGLDLFKTLNPSVDQVTEYLMNIRPDVLKRKMPKFLAEVIVKNEFNDIVNNTTQPVYDTKGNVTDNTIDLSETVTEQEVKRGAPQVREKIARPEGVKFSKTNINNTARGFLAKKGIKEFKFNFEGKEFTYKSNKGALKNSDNTAVKYYQYVTQEILPKYLPTSNLVNSNNYASRSDKFGRGHFMTGKQRSIIVDKGLKNENNFTETQRKIVKEAVSKKAFTITKKGKKQLVDFGSENYLQKTKNNYDGLEYILLQLEKMVADYPETSLYVAGLFNSASGNSGHFIRQTAMPRGVDQGFIDSGFKGEKEHVWQQNQAGEMMFEDIINGTVKDNFQFIRDNYFMLGISNTNNNKLKDLSGRYGEKYNYGNLPPKVFINALNEALENKDFSLAMSIWVRYFNQNVNGNNGGMNPNLLTFDGKTVAEMFNLKVDSNFKNNPDVIFFQNSLISEQIINGLDPKAAKELLNEYIKLIPGISKSKTVNVKNLTNNVVSFSKTDTNQDIIGYAKTVDEALAIARDPNAPVKKIRVFDFDDTLATTKSDVLFTTPDGTKGKLNAEEFAKQGSKLLEEGYVFDFSEFNKVTDGKPGPLLDIAKKIQEARGTEDVFVLTARAPEAQVAIKEFLDSVGLNIPLKNITGLGNSTGAAKANWIVNKAAEGYNDFYFADDALQNVRAVSDAMSQLDVKSKTQLAKQNNIKFSKSLVKPLDWRIEESPDGDGMVANFKIKDNDYLVTLYPVDTKGDYRYQFELETKTGSTQKITGTGNAISVFSTVYKGLLDAIKSNPKIKRVEFSADKSEPSRVRVYTSVMDRFAKDLGWNTDIWESTDWDGSGSFDFEITKPRKKRVKAVQGVLDVVDVKSEVQQAKIKFSKTLNEDFNKIIENTTGVAANKVYSKAKAQVRGANKGRFKFFIPYSAEDFLGLIYPTLSKGNLGDAQMSWYKKHILDPYTRAMESLSADRLQLMEDFKALKKALDVPKNLRKVNDSGFTNEQAVRVYLWNKMGYDVPGLSKTDLNELNTIVESDGLLKAFADQILNLTKGDGYSKPTDNWLVGTITTDLVELINTTKRSKYLQEWQQNIDEVYSQDNLNKLEAIYGSKYVEALKSTLSRMKSGKNRAATGNRLSNRILDYINGSVGAIMFFNTRSAVLQTISSINFVNWSFNNPLMAGKAFANQPQYWKDFKELMNSDYLVDRRNGLKLNISESEIADAAATSKNKAKAALNYLLQKGFLPTQMADSFAIASGGATFYRNRINDLIKNKGLTEAEAKAQAMLEFRQIAETSQQSSDPSKISQQQSSDVGRLLLAFANTPMQYARMQKRAAQDLINGRGDAKSNISKIIYYGFVQNLIFNALQQAVNLLGFGDDEEKEEEEYKKKMKIANGMADSLLRGLGIGGQAVSVGKNFLLDIYERSERKRPEYVDAMWKLMQFSPPISSKISKLKQAAWHFDSKKRREKIFEKGFSLDNPAYEAGAKVISATTNLPLDRVYSKVNNIEGALAEDLDVWQRLAMLGGWPGWQINPGKTKKQKENWTKNDGWKKDVGWKKNAGWKK